jgi:integrase
MPRGKKKDRDGIYTRPDRPGFWGSWTDAQGRRRRRQFKVYTLEQARMALAAEKLKVEETIKFGRPVPSKDSFAAFADEFLHHQKRRIAGYSAKGHITQAEYERQLGIVEQHLKPFFGEMKLASIRKAEVLSYINRRMGEVSDGTIIKERNVLRRMFNIALDKEKLAANPADGRSLRGHMPTEPEGRVRWLEKNEWERVFQACYISPDDDGNEQEQWLQQAAGLALALGARRGELMNAMVPDVDLRRGFIALRRTKNGKSRMVPINELARIVLDAMQIPERKRKKDRGALFGGITPAQLSMKFIRACRDAGVEDFSIHDLRHCHASWLRMQGADLLDIKDLLGHADLRMTARYAHLSQAHLAEASARLNGVFRLPAPGSREPDSEAGASRPTDKSE